MTDKARIGDIIVAKDDEGNELKRFLVIVLDDRVAALDKDSLKVQDGDVLDKTREELLEMTQDYVDDIEIVKEPSKTAEWFSYKGDEE